MNKIVSRFRSIVKDLNNQSTRFLKAEKFAEEGWGRLINVKMLLGGTAFVYLLCFIVTRKNSELSKYNMSFSRFISRITGKIANKRIPEPMRNLLFTMFAKKYGANLSEMALDLTDFTTFNEFFTRELKPGARKIHNLQDTQSICSPADSRVLVAGDVMNDTITCIKGENYPLDEFILGHHLKSSTLLHKLSQQLEEEEKVLKYIVLYLCPGDYHRYHSPAYWEVRDRRHIAGYLEPVKPKYIERHKSVLKNNERVALIGSWSGGFMTTILIGALNVGSIKIHFDPLLHSNTPSPSLPYHLDYKYPGGSLGGMDSEFTIPMFSLWDQTALLRLKRDTSNYLLEWDIRDMVDILLMQNRRGIIMQNIHPDDNNNNTQIIGDIGYIYNPEDEHKLRYNITNHFIEDGEGIPLSTTNTINPKLLIQPTEDKHIYTLTQTGIQLKKGEEMGMFRMGSTVAIIFAAHKNGLWKVDIGNKVQVGQEIFNNIAL